MEHPRHLIGADTPLLEQNQEVVYAAVTLDPFALHGREEAGLFARVAGGTARLYSVEEGVAVAVQADLDHPLRVPARRALAPELGAGARVVVGLSAHQGLLDRLAVRVGKRQDGVGGRVLGYDGDEAPLVELDLFQPVHLTGIPALRMCSLTSAMLHSPKWKMLAASTAPAPAWTAATMCSGPPAPPEATRGTLVFSATAGR